MSKIEDALRKARSMVPSSDGGSSEQALSARAVDGCPASGTSLGLHIESQRSIARMKEVAPFSAGELAGMGIVAPGMETDGVSNAFREVRTKIVQAARGGNCSVLVTAVKPKAGCSFVALNLAVAFSLDETKSALLMDSNLANPAFHKLHGREDGPGLSEYLEADDLEAEKIIYPVGVRRLRLVPAGRKQNAGREYFTTIKMRRLLAEITERYPDRYLVMDTPPILSSPDTRILAEACDFAVLVVPYGKVTESQIRHAAQAIGPSKLIGVVFNDEPSLPSRLWGKSNGQHRAA